MLLPGTLNPEQAEFVFSKDRLTGFYGGIGNGKTDGGCLRIMMHSDLWPGNRSVVGRLTYRELKDTTEKSFLDMVAQRNGGSLTPGPYVRKFTQNPDSLLLRNGSEVLFRYMDNYQSLLSLDVGSFYIDQAEFVAEETYLTMEGRLRWWTPSRMAQFHRKHNNVQKPEHYGSISGNPAPGWVFQRYKLNPKEVYRLIEASTESNRKNLPPNYIEDLRATNSETWVQRYLDGSWDTFKGQIYKNFQRSIHTIEPLKLPAHWPRFVGWDHGTTNPTAVIWMAVDEEGNIVVYREYYRAGEVIATHAEEAKKLSRGDNVKRSEDGQGIIVYMDPSVKGDHDASGRDFMQLYAEMGIFAIPANNRVRAGIDKISALMQVDPNRKFPRWHPRKGQKGAPRIYFYRDLRALINEIELYHWKDLPKGKEANLPEEPDKYLDHACDALRYGVMAVHERAPVEKKIRIPTYGEMVLQDLLKL